MCGCTRERDALILWAIMTKIFLIKTAMTSLQNELCILEVIKMSSLKAGLKSLQNELCMLQVIKMSLLNYLVTSLQNELCILEVIHCLVETLDRFFSNVCELDLMFNLEMVSPPSLPACCVASDDLSSS